MSYEEALAPADEHPPPVDIMVEAFLQRLRAGAPFRDERQAADELAKEAGPVLEALYVAWHLVQQEGGDPLGHAHEALAMLTLLGRRAAQAGITPTTALAVAPALRAALGEGGLALPDPTERTLSIVCMEGYVAGRDDRHASELGQALMRAQRWACIAPGVLLWFAAGPLDGPTLDEVGEEFGRELLRNDAKACVVDVVGMEEPTADKGRALLGVVEAAATVGAACYLAVDASWRSELEALKIEQAGGLLVEGLAPAVGRALAHAGFELRRKGRRWSGLFGGGS